MRAEIRGNKVYFYSADLCVGVGIVPDSIRDRGAIMDCFRKLITKADQAAKFYETSDALSVKFNSLVAGNRKRKGSRGTKIGGHQLIYETESMKDAYKRLLNQAGNRERRAKAKRSLDAWFADAASNHCRR